MSRIARFMLMLALVIVISFSLLFFYYKSGFEHTDGDVLFKDPDMLSVYVIIFWLAVLAFPVILLKGMAWIARASPGKDDSHIDVKDFPDDGPAPRKVKHKVQH